ncbi:MAG: gliding motility-associated C-terminal domain-containing protein [Bacteroidia bacterium]|nr:gliding motility-associated C-terminal domain-containing protein [Bacteroidia bacterium]
MNSQTLYWVGGSGNFNDAAHWSLVSGGTPANQIPSSNTTVSFDENSGSEYYEVTFTKNCSFKNFRAGTYNNLVRFKSESSATVNVKGSVFMADNVVFESTAPMLFAGNPGTANTLEFGKNTLKCDLIFNSGEYNLKSLNLSTSNSLIFNGGVINMNRAFITAGNFLNPNPSVKFNVKDSHFKIENKVDIKSYENFISNNLEITAQTTSKTQYLVPSSFSSSKKLSSNNINSGCPIVVSLTPACTGTCTGIMAISFPTTCIDPPYDIQIFSNCNISSSITSNFAVITLTAVPPGNTFTLGGMCACSTNLFCQILDGASPQNTIVPTVVSPPSSPINFNGNLVILNTTTTAPTCNSSCNGSLTGQFVSGGVYSIAVSPSTVTPSSFTVNAAPFATAFSLTGLCGSAYTFSIADQFGCSTVTTKTLNAPPPLLANATKKDLNCNAINNGAFSVSPTGGTANYTVSFSSGATLSTTAGGTVSVGSLPPGAVSATVTDSKGCTAIATATITQPVAYTITPTQTNVTCPGFSTGIAAVSVGGGQAPYTFTWSPTGGNTSTATGLGAGSYTVNISDALSCLVSSVITITQPTSITLTPSVTNLSCNGVCNGSATVSATGPTTAISFTWLATGGLVISTTNTINSRCAGIYTIIAKDAPSTPTCVVTRTINITQPPSFTIAASTQSISCATSTCSGSATLNVSGSNGTPYTYTWTPGAISTSVATSLCAGTYTAAVRDASGCVTSTVVTIAQPPTFSAGITTGSVACSGASTGSINSTPTGGTGPYTFTLVSFGSTLTSSPPYTNLPAGNYTLLIKDSSPATCAQAFTASLQQAPTLVPAISSTSLTCFNVCNGSLGGSAAGGTPTYTFTWATPTGTVAGGALSGRCAGVYILTVRDANNCTVTATRTLTQPSDATITIVTTNVACNSGTTGVLSANVVGGTPGYTLSWSNGFTGNPNSGLGAGNYTLTVTDANSCIKTSTAVITQPLPISLTRTTTATSCAGGCNGSATVTATGGNGPYNFSFNSVPVVNNTSGIISGLCAGNYIASVTDASSCVTSTVFAITSPPLLSAAITGTQNSCTACTGAATVTGSNGTPGYTFVWTNSLSATVSTNAAASSLCAGNYTVSVIDSKSCVATTTVNIQQTVISAAVLGSTGIQCFGACTGSAVASPSGGTPPYNYTWTPSGQTTQTATGLCAQVYTVTIKEQGSSGCSSQATINIATPPALSVTTTQANLTCFSVCTGSMFANATGGTGAKSYSWSPGGQTTSSITGQCAGTYTLRVSDANGCTTTPTTFSITQPASITANFTNTTPSGCTLSNGSVCVGPTGGAGAGYTYTWSPVTGSASCLTGLAAGFYSVTIADGSGCSASFSTSLNSPAGPTITVSQQSVACFGTSTGGATVTASGTPAFSYTWSPAVAGNTPAASGLPAGSYVVTVRDGNSCVTNQSITITQATSLTLNQTVTNSRCSGGTQTGSITLTPTGAATPYIFSWSGPSFTSTSQNITGLGPGIYTLSVIDAVPCPAKIFTFNVTAPPAITITASSTKSVICAGINNGSISATASGGTPPLSFTWAPLSPFTGSTTSTVLNLGPGIYSVSAVDANSCVSTPATWTLAASTLSTAIVQQSATCSNSCNASATLNVTGGSPTYTFSWSSGGSTTNSSSGLCVGNYTASVVDGDGCISQKGFTISPASLFSITAAPSQPLCSGSCNGSVAITPTGGIGAVNYVWSPTGSGQNPTNLCAGNYTVVATDGNSCSATSVITLTNPPAILSNVTFTNPLCNNNCNGIAVVNPTNAIGVVTVTWLPTGPNSKTITALCAGTFTSVIQDANGCVDTQTFTLTNPPALNVNTSFAPSTCGASNGSITLIPSGGTPGYTYTWSPNVSSTVSATGLSAQIYTVVVKDNANCSNTVTIPLSNSNGPTAPVSFTNVLCFGQSNGAVSVGAFSGGTPPYLPAVWITPPPASTVNTLSNIPAGNYTVQLEDNAGCITFTGATVTGPSSVSVLANMGLPTCNGICNGSITLNVTGGVPGYSYSWTPALPATSVQTGLCAGDYTVLIGHNSGSCTQTQTFNVPGQVNLTFTDNVVPNNCFGNCNGVASVSVLPTAGIPSPFVFSWSNGTTGPGPLTTSVGGLCNGLYSVTATGANGCFNTYTVNITSPTQLTVSSSVLQPSCNLCNGSATVTPGGGSGSTYTINWASGATTNTLGNLCAGIYPITVTDNNGCSQTNTVIVDNSTGISGHTVTTLDIPCGATCTGAATITATGTNTPISYNWVTPALNGSVQTNLCPGPYFVQLQDAQGCIRNASLTINAATNITISPFVLPPNCGFTNGTVNVVVSGGTPTYNFSWVPLGPNSGTLSNVGAGSYTLTVTDTSPGGCPTSSVVNVSNNTGPVVAISATNINCFNACTGALSANATSTALPLSYNWSGGGSTPTLSNMCKGVITLTVTDANGCSTVKSATLTDNPKIQTIIPAVIQPSCNLCNGQAVVTAFGGIGPYTYSWTSGASTNSITNLCAGLYQLLITDLLNCQQTETVTINNSNGITGHNFSVQDVTCGGNCDGAATVTPVGGNLPISFSWINPTIPVTGNSVNNLCPGVYFVQMQDAQGCLRTASTNINSATNISLTPFIVPPACGFTNGIISVQASGGTPTLSFNWLPAGPNNGTLTNIGPGSYTLTVSDTSPGGCPTTTVMNISNLNAPNIALTSTNINCFNACTGAVSANVTGTASPFTYNWSGGGNTPNIDNLCNGVITLTVTDTNSCVAVKSQTITQNPQLQASAPLITQPTCNQCNGQAVVNAIGGVAPYTFTWTSGAVGASISNLCAGLYQVLITDNLNCQKTENIVINNSNGITGETFTVQNVACSGNCNGGATVTPVGGASPYGFNWINPALSTTTSAANNLCVGTYFVKMTDANGCIRTSSTNISAASNMSIVSNIVQPGCGLSNGIISLNVSGGTTPYTYSWSPVAGSSASLTGLAPGNYTVLVIDQNGAGCSQLMNFNLNNLSGPTINYTQTNVSCFGLCDGSVAVVTTGTAATTFTWSTGSSSANSGSNCAGVISLTASANGCNSVKTFTIEQKPKLELDYGLKKISCGTTYDGQITLLPIGGELAYTFSGTSGLNSNTSSSLCVGDYTLTVTDVNGCVADTVIKLIKPVPISPTITSLNSSCSSVADGSAAVVASGGTPKYTYLWTGPSSFTAVVASINNIFSGDYTLSVTDSLGCRRDSVLKIITTVTIEANAGQDTLVCPGSSVKVTGINSNGVVNYSWYLLPNNTATVANTASFSIPGATNSYTYELVTTSSNPGCLDRDTVVIKAFSTPYIEAGASFTIPIFATVTIGGNPTTEGIGSVTWSPAGTINDSNLENPVASNTVSTTYTVALSYGNGCLVSDTMQVFLYPAIIINNGFSPNNDGKNDVWLIDNLEQFPDNTVEIYNRWGDLLFSSVGYQVPFNGKYKGNDLPVGTYYYVIHLNHPAYPKPYTGPLTIFR